jgi:hypothetical protein
MTRESSDSSLYPPLITRAGRAPEAALRIERRGGHAAVRSRLRFGTGQRIAQSPALRPGRRLQISVEKSAEEIYQ